MRHGAQRERDGGVNQEVLGNATWSNLGGIPNLATTRQRNGGESKCELFNRVHRLS